MQHSRKEDDVLSGIELSAYIGAFTNHLTMGRLFTSIHKELLHHA